MSASETLELDALRKEVSGFNRIVAKITGLFDWRKSNRLGGDRGHIEVSQSFYCRCGKAVNVRDRRAKRYHQGKGHGPR